MELLVKDGNIKDGSHNLNKGAKRSCEYWTLPLHTPRHPHKP